MDSISAFAMGAANRGRELKVFDWDLAAERIVAAKARNASAGLAGDWEWTGGPILRDGSPIPDGETYTFLASTWATPELEIDGDLRNDCMAMQSATPGWDDDTYWPESALAILREGGYDTSAIDAARAKAVQS